MHRLARTNGQYAQVDGVLNRRSGLLGLSGISGDIRDVLRREDSDDQLGRAAGVYLGRLRKYLGSYLRVVGSAQAVIFTDTIGEEASSVREALCDGMDAFGLHIDGRANRNATVLPVDVACECSSVRILIVHTNEERAIARTAFRCLRQPTAA